MRTMPVLSFYVRTYRERRTRNQDRDDTFKNLAKYTPFLYASSLWKDKKAEKKGEENSAQVLASPKGDVDFPQRTGMPASLQNSPIKSPMPSDHTNSKDFL